MGRYAETTTVSAEQSKAEIERMLARYGATAFASGWQGDRAVISFEISNRRVRFILPLPSRSSREITHTPERGLLRPPSEQERCWRQSTRQRWRALALVVKAKLEAVESKVTSFDDEFMAHIVMPDGKTVGEHTLPMIASAYESGTMPKLLAGY